MQNCRERLRGAQSEVLIILVNSVPNLPSYSKLLGLNRQKAAEMREQDIELPQTIDQLQFLTLQLREELIETRSAYEHAQDEW